MTNIASALNPKIMTAPPIEVMDEDKIMNFTEANGVSLRYAVEGSGKTLVLIHEMGGTMESWGLLAPLLSPKRRIVRYDTRGAGFSEKIRKPMPEIYQWNLAIQNQVGANMVVELAYVASHGTNLAFPVDINQVPVGKLSPNDSPSGLPYANYQAINGSTNNAISNYNSLQASVTRRMSPVSSLTATILSMPANPSRVGISTSTR